MSRNNSVHQEQTQSPAAQCIGDDEALVLSRTCSQQLNGVESIATRKPVERKPSDTSQTEPAKAWPGSTKYFVLLTAYITSLSFGVTQVPLLYVFRLMQCDVYYKDRENLPAGHSSVSITALNTFFRLLAVDTGHSSDRCSIHPIESATALQISILAAVTTIFGTLNLFLTGALIKKIGVKPTLLIQILFPALRLFIQAIGVEVWGSTGILIVQCSQITTVIGGPSGYLLALNTMITDIVEHEGRTAALGRLTGSMMFGSASGFLLGGFVAEVFGIKAPFRLAFVLFSLSTLFAAVTLPRILPQRDARDTVGTGESKRGGSFFMLKKFLGPLTVFAPKDFVLLDGTIQKQWGPFLLAWGVFLGILATGYLVTLLQLYATDVFGFGTKANGWLIFIYSILRGAFLTFIFPKLISIGHEWSARKEKLRMISLPEDRETQPLLTSTMDVTDAEDDKKPKTFTFDLTYTRFSLIADGTLTLLCTFVREGWQMYLVACVLPFAAGTGSAAKGTVLQMVGASASSSERTDALAGISLVENMARLSTVFVFGVIFAAFASVGRLELVFVCNAGVALIGFCVLLLARFPPEGSRRLEHQDGGAQSEQHDGQ